MLRVSREADIEQQNATGVFTREEQPALDGAKGQRHMRSNTSLGDGTGRSVESRWQIERRDGCPPLTRQHHHIAQPSRLVAQ